MKQVSPQTLIRITGGMMTILIILLTVMLWRQGTVVDQLVGQEIERNNLTSSETLEEPISGRLKPQIINIRGNKKTLNLPDQYTIDIVNDQIETPQSMAVDGDGNVYVTDRDSNTLSILPASDRSTRVLVDGALPRISGVVWYNQDVYVASGENIYVYRDVQLDGTYISRDTLVDDLPRHDGRVGKQILIKDNRLFVSIPARCDSCEENDPRYGSIVSYTLDGAEEELYAKGLHSVGGMIQVDNQIVSIDQGRTGISAALPPGELNRISQGKDYGWPFCYGKTATDPRYPGKVDFCDAQAEAPIVELSAHVAPTGIVQIQEGFSGSLAGRFMISYAGSDSYTVPQGYKIVVVDLDTGQVQNLVTGWLENSGEYWGNPGAMIPISDSEFLIADTESGVIYRLTRSS